MNWIDHFYAKLLRFSMAHRWLILVLCIVVTLSTVPLFMLVGKNFLPEIKFGSLSVVHLKGRKTPCLVLKGGIENFGNISTFFSYAGKKGHYYLGEKFTAF